MDFQRFGIDARLAKAAESLPTSFFYYEKMLAHAVEMQENVCVKIALDAGREEVLLLPALQWLVSGEGRKLLIVVPDSTSAERFALAADRLGSAAGLGVCIVSKDEAAAGGEAAAEGQPTLHRLQGEASASVLIGTAEGLLFAPGLNLRDYGFLVVDGVDRLAELPPDLVRRLTASLLPSWERRSALACSKFSVKVKNLAWDLADNPSEISIEGEVAKAQSVLKETWKVPVEAKLKFLLGLIGREKPARLCVFCNLKDTATDLARRLSSNGIASDTILGPLVPERKFALIEKFRAGDSTCLTLSDEGAEGLTPGVFPLIVNYDIPLEPELFVKRLEMLDRSDPGAKVISIACDRYIFGLPAVEQYIDARLEAVPADESMLSAIDRSEARGPERKQREDSSQRDPRRAQAPRRDSHRRDEGRREIYPRDAFPREANPRDAHSREARNNPDIRKSISEATGGTLDMSGAGPSDRLPSSRPPARNDSRRGHGPERSTVGPKTGRRGERGDKPPSPRGQPSRQAPNRPAGTRPGVSGHGPTRPGLPGNPYEMPMEERMKLYREKYGRGLGGSDDKNVQRKGQRHGGEQHPQEPTKSAPSNGGNTKNGTSRGAPGQSQNRNPTEGPDKNHIPQAMPLQPQPQAETKSEGFMSRILGGLRKKKSSP